MRDMFNFTFNPTSSRQSGGQTIKSASSAVTPGEVIDDTIGPSIFDLPMENLRKLQDMRENKN